jgi:hypothetical protein
MNACPHQVDRAVPTVWSAIDVPSAAGAYRVVGASCSRRDTTRPASAD